jgi:hypothetical protein
MSRVAHKELSGTRAVFLLNIDPARPKIGKWIWIWWAMYRLKAPLLFWARFLRPNDFDFGTARRRGRTPLLGANEPLLTQSIANWSRRLCAINRQLKPKPAQITQQAP